MNDAQQAATHAEIGEVGLVEPHDFVCSDPFEFENGAFLPGFTLRYETYGHLSRAKDNAILICHALSGDHHCAGVHSLRDRKPGWWDTMVGPGKPIDTRRFFVVASNCLGGCQGSTGPSSLNPETGSPYALDFPALTIADMVKAQDRLRAHLGIDRWNTVAGGSMGGMQALQWAVSFPDRVGQILALATTARQNAQAIAFNEVGRTSIRQDPAWQGGAYSNDAGPRVGLAVARMMAHITYLSDRAMEDKFGRNRREKTLGRQLSEVEFEVESYLHYQGKTFVNRFDANTYLYFTKALDRFDLAASAGGSLEAAFANTKARFLVVGFSSDWLFPPAQNRRIVEALLRAGKQASYAEIDADLGHDSFLLDAPEYFSLVRAFLGT
jgi:homoserine O-acetyltransferase